MGAIPFYGAGNRRLFEIERAAMDRPGRVITALDEVLPREGVVLDVGAGDGSTAERLSRAGRKVVAVEPAEGMRRPGRRLLWAGGEAEHLPLRSTDALLRPLARTPLPTDSDLPSRSLHAAKSGVASDDVAGSESTP